METKIKNMRRLQSNRTYSKTEESLTIENIDRS
jgi:hypothetical protein